MVARQVAHRTALPAAEKLGMPAVYSLLAVGANGQVAVRMNVGEGAIDQSAEHVVIGHRKLRGSIRSRCSSRSSSLFRRRLDGMTLPILTLENFRLTRQRRSIWSPEELGLRSDA